VTIVSTCVVDYLQADEVAAASSSRVQLVDPAGRLSSSRERLDRFLPPLDLRRPHTNAIQPIRDPQGGPRATSTPDHPQGGPWVTFPGPGDGGKETGKERVDGDDEGGGKTAASVVETETAGYSSGPDDDDDDDADDDAN